MFQGWHAPFCQIALNCWEISSSVVNLLIGLLETDVPRHGCTKGNYDPKLWRTLLPGGRGHSPNINMILNNTFHKLAFAKRNKNILWNAVSLWWTGEQTPWEGLAYFLGGDQPKNKLRIVTKSVFITSMPFSFALSLSFFCRHDCDGASGNSSWHLWKIAVYNLTSYISPICLCV